MNGQGTNKPKVFGYARVSTRGQTVESQKQIVLEYCNHKRVFIDEWKEIVISSNKSIEDRGIEQLITELHYGDHLLVSEISRLGRSNSQVNNIIQRMIDKGVTLHLCKQNLVINGPNKNEMVTKVLLTVFGMMAELEKDIIRERTKGGIERARLEGKQIGKKKGTKQKTMYDSKLNDITYYLSRKKISLEGIVSLIGIGKRKSLHNFIKTRNLKTKALKIEETKSLNEYLQQTQEKK
jgi:DNA invertase Pin-like site-specific DNA recombinase